MQNTPFTKSSKKILFFAVLLALFFSILFQVVFVFAGATESARGFAWSSGVNANPPGYQGMGWISMNSLSDGSGVSYGVNIPAGDGAVTGYAWSGMDDSYTGGGALPKGQPGAHYGWISFNAADTASCGVPAARVGNSIKGFAKILASNDGGFDGCISLSGTATNGTGYGVAIAGNTLSGYAWSSDLGWIDFSGVTFVDVPQCSDGIDNADPEDTLVDMADPGCSSPSDPDETDGALPQCSDGIDNADPEDTLVDMADPGCSDPSDTDETDVAGLPDLTVGSFSPAAGAPTFDNPTSVIFSGTITDNNAPTLPGENVWADVEIDWDQGNPALATAEVVLNAGGPWTQIQPGVAGAKSMSRTLTAAASELRNGTHSYRMIADRDNLVTESNNTNNAGPWTTFTIANLPQCSDGIDNADPEDTLVDMADPGCSSPSDTDETNGGGSGCTSQTINNCLLPATNSNTPTAGTCSGAYRGTCSYTCNTTTFTWEGPSANACYSGDIEAAPATLIPGNPSTISWQVTPSAGCWVTGTNGDHWDNVPSNNTNPREQGISSPLSDNTMFTLACGTQDNLLDTVTIGVSGPTISGNPRVVDIGKSTQIKWDTKGAVCTLSGGTIVPALSVSGLGNRDVTVNAQTTFTLNCTDPLVPGSSFIDTVTVDITGWQDDT